MNLHLNSKRMTYFQQIFAALCVLMTDLCIFLFFSILASKLRQLLITDKTVNTDRIQREFLFNVAIATRAAFLASSPPRQETNLFKQFGVGSPRQDEEGLGQRFRANKQTFPNER